MLTYLAKAYHCRLYVEMLQRLQYLMTHCELKAEERAQLLWMLPGRQQWS